MNKKAFNKIRSMINDSMSKKNSNDLKEGDEKLSILNYTDQYGPDQEAYKKSITENGSRGEKPFPSLEYAMENFRTAYINLITHSNDIRTIHFRLNNVSDHRDVWCIIARDATVVHGYAAVEGILAADKMTAPKS